MTQNSQQTLNSQFTEDFLDCFRRLPQPVRDLAGKVHRRWRDDPSHPPLIFQCIHATESLYSLRIGVGWRALGLDNDGVITWFWIGSHAEYEEIIANF